MKYVCKGEEPAGFREWKGLADDGWEPTWADLRAPEKPDLHEALVQEQGAVCCYCGRRITTADSHIEHFRPRADYDDRALDFTNLLASCQRNERKGVPRVCGRAKGEWFDEASHIDPQDPGCEERFRFGSQGGIWPRWETDSPAETMVYWLNLDDPLLRKHRELALNEVFSAGILEDEDDVGLRAIARVFGQTDEQGRLPDMGHVVRRWLEDFLEASS